MGKTWVGFITDKNYDFSNFKQVYGIPPTYIIRRFELSSFEKVRIRIATLGVFSLYINGHLVNDEFMSEDFSEYNVVTYYRDYNISKYLVQGINTLGVVLCDGWYASNLSHQGKNLFGTYPLKLFYEIYVDKQLRYCADGSEFAAEGPIRACDNQNGIVIDHNLEIKDFATNACDLTPFYPVEVFELNINLKKSLIKPVTKHQTFKPKLLWKTDDYSIFDFGQNFAGVTHLFVKGRQNTKITISHAEVLDADGDVYTKNLRTALAKGTYILSGEGVEEFLPRTVFYGFRYIKIEHDQAIEIESLRAYAIYTDCKRRGIIQTNNKLVNRIYKNVLWGQRSNFLSVPTDCPQRDERMGWTGDAQVIASTSLYNYDTSKFLRKFVYDMISSQKLYGDGVPSLSPYCFFRLGGIQMGIQGWSDAIIIIPYYLYLFENDYSLLNRTFQYMVKFMNFIDKNRIKRGVFEGKTYGDWLSVFEVTDLNLYNDLYYLYDNLLMSKIARILIKRSAIKYENKFNDARIRFRKRHFKDGKLTSDTQAAYVLAYAFGLLDKEEIHDNLVRKISEFGHLTTGFHATRYLLPTLCEIGEKQLAFKLLNNKEYPSWGYEIACGATTIWERWDSYRKDVGFNPHGMNSFNHPALGSVGHWMYATMLGISPTIDDPGFKTTIVRPEFDISVSKLSGKVNTKSGIIEVDFVIKNKEVIYHIKADKKINLVFDFQNKVIDRNICSENDYIFTLEY